MEKGETAMSDVREDIAPDSSSIRRKKPPEHRTETEGFPLDREEKKKTSRNLEGGRSAEKGWDGMKGRESDLRNAH